jgi:ABC-2 type transport system ATP-binding protein
VEVNAPAVIETRGLTRRFGDFVAVDNLDISVAKGEIFGFLGPNGSGKSTTIRMLTGILQPSSGTARVAGFEVGRESRKIKFRIGYMSQKFSLYEDLQVAENLSFFAAVYRLPKALALERIQWALDYSELADQRKTMTRDLPGGIRQRLALACALMHRPEILFLDEPTSGVDPIARRRFWETIYDLSKGGVTILVGMILDGKMVALGTPRALKQEIFPGHKEEPSMEDVFVELVNRGRKAAA